MVSSQEKEQEREGTCPSNSARYEDQRQDKHVETPYNPFTCIWINDTRRFTVALSAIDIFKSSASIYPLFTFLFIPTPLKNTFT